MQLANNRDVILKRILDEHPINFDETMSIEDAQKVLTSMGIQDALSLLSARPITRHSDDRKGFKGQRSISEVQKTARESSGSATDPQARILDTSEALTPAAIVSAVLDFFDGSIDLDPCTEATDPPNVPARMHYTREDDGLDPSNAWAGNVFVHAPIDNAADWVSRAVPEYATEQVNEAVLLLFAETEANWMPLLDCYPRLVFRSQNLMTDPNGQPTAAPVVSKSLIVGLIQPARVSAFAESFGELGALFVPYSFQER